MSACIPDMPSFLHYHRPWTNFKIIATRRGIAFGGSVKPGKVIRSEVKSAYAVLFCFPAGPLWLTCIFQDNTDGLHNTLTYEPWHVFSLDPAFKPSVA